MSLTIGKELQLLWDAHRRVGLTGKMCLYSIEGSRPWPTKSPGTRFWFGPDEIEQASQFFTQHYNKAAFPYTPLLLDPVVHTQTGENEYKKLGSGVIWTSALAFKNIPDEKIKRIRSLGAAAGYVSRGEHPQSGLKILAFSNTALPVEADGTVQGCKALYELADIKGEEYWPFYLLSEVSYASNSGGYHTPTLPELFEDTHANESMDAALGNALIEKHTVDVKTITNALTCWERYDRHPGLYDRFGNNVEQLDDNLKFYNYCARDFQLFDSIGPGALKQEGGSGGGDGFDFLVHGLVPRGSIVLLAGTGGTGKSSIAHKLCCLAATDWRDDEQPMWLGQPVVKANSKGIPVYFSGEDGPAIINARNEIFDPEKRATRLMFQRNHFSDGKGNEIEFAAFLNRLREMPEVPLLVIDPARKYLTGDEDDAAVVSEFFEAIEKFAHERNSAVIVVHHLSKGAKPTSAREVLDELRGSQVFIDRPRVVIGMFREGPKTVVGLAKCNIPPSLGMVTQERVFAHNPQTLDLTQLPGKDGVRDPYQAPTDDEE